MQEFTYAHTKLRPRKINKKLSFFQKGMIKIPT